MELIVDFHTHSHYSRATSSGSNLEGLYKWGKIKGINIIGSGDFTHPGWFLELQEKLEPAEPGLFKLKAQYADPIDATLPPLIKEQTIRFLLTVEISNIYSKYGKVRKLHNLVVAPSLEVAEKINQRLSQIGNLKADGRPILGLDSKELLKICLQTDPYILFIPAHIWTPHFALFGSNSGFDSLEEAFEELAPQIKAVETGLSADPFMNWRLDQLQNLTIVSNSDAHSPSKLGREATVMDCQLDYFDIFQGIHTNDQRVYGTIEFFPQEGKYHFDGHREHNVCFSPQQTKEHQGLCPVCGKILTVGVEHRVDDLATNPANYKPQNHKSVEYIIPLIEIIAEVNDSGPTSKAVLEIYHKMYFTFGNEFTILRQLSLETIESSGFSQLALAIAKMRKGEIIIQPGYDGVYGVIKVFKDNDEKKKSAGQMSFL